MKKKKKLTFSKIIMFKGLLYPLGVLLYYFTNVSKMSRIKYSTFHPLLFFVIFYFNVMSLLIMRIYIFVAISKSA